MGRKRSSRKQDLTSQESGGRVFDLTDETPVVSSRRRAARDEWEWDDAEPDMDYAPRVRVTARPLGRHISSVLLAEPLSEPLSEPLLEPWSEPLGEPLPEPVTVVTSIVARPAILRFPAKVTERLQLKTSRRKTLFVYLALFLVVAQTMVGALTPLGRSEQQALSGAVNALGAAAPFVPTPFPSGPTPQPVTSPEAFIQAMLPYAEQAHQDLGWPVSVVLAQMGVEHGWRLPDFDGWNLANSRPFLDPNGDGGVCYNQSIIRNFCYASTPWIGLAIYEHCAHLSYYSAIARAAQSGGALAAAQALGQSPWDAGHYAAGGIAGQALINAMNTFNLRQYD